MKAEAKPLAVHFGGNVRVYRRRAGISQEELGFRSSLHRTEIGLLERGAREPRLSTIIKLADALSVPPHELLAGIRWERRGTSPGEIKLQGQRGGDRVASPLGVPPNGTTPRYGSGLRNG